MLTQLALFDLFRCNPKNREHFDHYLNDHIHHFRGRLRCCVNLDSSKKPFDALKNVDKSVFSGSNILDCLREVRVTMAYGKLSRIVILTERRIPTPANITFAGANACYTYMRVWNSKNVMKHTMLVPASRMEEKACKTFTVGSSHLDHRSSVLRD